MLIITAFLAIIIIICGFFIIYTVYFRFLKILIIVPLGAIACSTMAGNRMVSHTMATYCKYFLSCVFEAVTMALAIVVCNAFINAVAAVDQLRQKSALAHGTQLKYGLDDPEPLYS